MENILLLLHKKRNVLDWRRFNITCSSSIFVAQNPLYAKLKHQLFAAINSPSRMNHLVVEINEAVINITTHLYN